MSVSTYDWTKDFETWNNGLAAAEKMTDIQKLDNAYEWTTPISSSTDYSQTGRISMVKGTINNQSAYYLGWSTQVNLPAALNN